MEELQGLGQIGTGIIRRSAGVGYIIIPDGIDRDAYVEQCLRKGTVSFLTENNELIADVKIDAQALQFVNFPEAFGDLGSAVVWVNIPVHEKPVIIAVMEEEGNTGEQHFKFKREFKGQRVELSGNAKIPALNATVKGTKAAVNIHVLAPDNGAELNVHVKGNINLYAEGTVKVQASEGLTYEDGYENKMLLNSEGTQILSKKILFGEGKEAVPLGDTLKGVLEDILDELGKLKVATAFGTSSIPLNTPAFVQIKAGLNKILSQLSFTD